MRPTVLVTPRFLPSLRVIMALVFLIILAIVKEYEPLLLFPIGAG